MTAWLLMLLALVAGAALASQAAINAVLAGGAGNALWASAISFFVGLLVLVLAGLAVRAPWPAMAGLTALPWWAWTGGALGALYVASAIVVVPKLGAATLIALVVAGQMLAALLLDHFGALGLPEQSITIWRLLGACMLIGGVVLIRGL